MREPGSDGNLNVMFFKKFQIIWQNTRPKWRVGESLANTMVGTPHKFDALAIRTMPLKLLSFHARVIMIFSYIFNGKIMCLNPFVFCFSFSKAILP